MFHYLSEEFSHTINLSEWYKSSAPTTKTAKTSTVIANPTPPISPAPVYDDHTTLTPQPAIYEELNDYQGYYDKYEDCNIISNNYEDCKRYDATESALWCCRVR